MVGLIDDDVRVMVRENADGSLKVATANVFICGLVGGKWHEGGIEGK
jgi:hypothetical protein